MTTAANKTANAESANDGFEAKFHTFASRAGAGAYRFIQRSHKMENNSQIPPNKKKTEAKYETDERVCESPPVKPNGTIFA